MEFRRAVADDWPGIWSIWHAVVAAGDTYCWPPETDERTARGWWMLPEPARVFVAVERDRIVGTALLKPNQLGPGDHVANAAFMIDPAEHGRGLGRELAGHVLRQARELGYQAMQFNAVVSTNTGAVALWRGLGFTVIGTVPGGFRHPELGLVDLYSMFRRLG
jgi:L-amino acid N-acyltransferase YncA